MSDLRRSAKNMNPIISTLPTKKTWLLILLAFVTYFVYPAHYVKKISARLNEETSEAPEIFSGLVWVILFSSYLSLALFFITLGVDDDHPIAKISSAVDRLVGIPYIFWAFEARSRLHALLSSSKGSPYWFHGFWTFIFGVFYINFKLEKLKKAAF